MIVQQKPCGAEMKKEPPQKSASQYGVKGRVVLRRIGKDVLLVPVSGPAAAGGGRVYPLNETAEIIWGHLVAGTDISRIVCDLKKRYDVPPSRIEADVEECIKTFLDEDLLERIDP